MTGYHVVGAYDDDDRGRGRDQTSLLMPEFSALLLSVLCAFEGCMASITIEIPQSFPEAYGRCNVHRIINIKHYVLSGYISIQHLSSAVTPEGTLSEYIHV